MVQDAKLAVYYNYLRKKRLNCIWFANLVKKFPKGISLENIFKSFILEKKKVSNFLLVFFF